MINANNNGMKLESETASLVTKYLSYAVEPYRTTKTKDNVLLKNAPYRSIYGRNSRTEFLLLHGGRRIRIECKAQHSQGSVDEKLPYLYENFKRAIPEKEAIIVIEGEGFKKGSKEWLRHKARGTKIQVFSLTQFEEYLSKGLPKKSLFTRLKEIFFHVHEYTNLQLCTFYHNT
tara:strand:- start:614 stop:1135 length:522 start_codon:yes stop_codon:yes gene_type:complete